MDLYDAVPVRSCDVLESTGSKPGVLENGSDEYSGIPERDSKLWSSVNGGGE